MIKSYKNSKFVNTINSTLGYQNSKVWDSIPTFDMESYIEILFYSQMG